MTDLESSTVDSDSASLWVCPRCHTPLDGAPSSRDDRTLPLEIASRLVHTSASLQEYASICPNCELPYTAQGAARFSYPYRQLLAKVDLRRFLRWSSAQSNGYVSYSLMKGSSCSVTGRKDVNAFSEFIMTHLADKPRVLLDLGCGPLPRPSYLPFFPGARRVGIDPFESSWDGSFVEGAGEFIPLADASVDLSVAATALDHTLGLELAVRELARVTRPGGNLMVWDHTFPPRTDTRRRALFHLLLPTVSWPTKVRQLRSAFLRERVRIYDNGIVLWTPKGYADPFHEPRSRRPSWTPYLRKTIEEAGFTLEHDDPANGFSHYVR